MTRRAVVTLIMTLFAVVVVGGGILWARRSTPVVQWTMVNVSSGDFSGDAHVLDFRDGRIYLVDTGFDHFARHRLIPFLRKHGIRHIDRLIITHAHKNHYGGILSLLKAGVTVDEVVFNLPARAACDAERPWGCDYNDAAATVAALRDKGITVTSAHPGDVLYRDEDRHIVLKVLYVYDGVHTPVGRTGINDTSIIMRLAVGPRSVMFAGDLDKALGGYLVAHGTELRATILKVPHHGLESAAPNAFFDRVAPKIALVPGPEKLWLSDRGRRIRQYLKAHRIRTYINGVHHNVSVAFLDDGLRVETNM